MPRARLVVRIAVAAIVTLGALALAAPAAATCQLIGIVVPAQRPWYGPSSPPIQVVTAIVDDSGAAHDVLDESSGAYYATSFDGGRGWVASPPWSTFVEGSNSLRAALFCADGTQVARVAVGYDSIAPSATFTAPASDAWVRGVVALTVASADGLSGVAGTTVLAPDGTRLDAGAGAASFDTTLVADGPELFQVAAVDRAGNVSPSATRRLLVDNTPPSVAFAGVADGASVHGSIDLALAASDGGSRPGSAWLEGRQPGGAWSVLATDDDPPFAVQLDTDTLADGVYQLRASARDAVGNVGVGPYRRVRVDNTPPAVTLRDPGPRLSGAVPLVANASDGGAGLVRVRIEAAPAASGAWTPVGTATAPPYSAWLDATTLRAGDYDLRAIAVDAAGNEAASPIVTRPVGTAAPAPPATPGTHPRALTLRALRARIGPHRESRVVVAFQALRGGGPVAGARIVIRVATGRRTRSLVRGTDAHGVARVTLDTPAAASVSARLGMAMAVVRVAAALLSVDLRVSPAAPRAGGSVTLSGRIVGSSAARVVQIQALTRTGWSVVAQVRTASGGRFRAVLLAGPAGRYAVRAVVVGRPRARSATVSFQVRR